MHWKKNPTGALLCAGTLVCLAACAPARTYNPGDPATSEFHALRVLTCLLNPCESAAAAGSTSAPLRYVAGNTQGQAFYSDDGTSWTGPIAATGGNAITALAFGNGTFTIGEDGSGIMRFSADGITWTNGTDVSSALVHALAFGNGRFIAGQDEGEVAESLNGSSWSADITAASNSVLGFVYGSDRFVAVSTLGGVHWSLTGSSGWSANIGPGGANNLRGVAFGNGRYVAVGDAGAIHHSADGNSWSTNVGPGSQQLRAIAFGNNVFVAVGASGQARVSSDGISWGANTGPGGNTLRAIAFDGTRFMAAGDGGNVYTSSDGITWQGPVSVGAPQNLQALTYAPLSQLN